MEQSYKEKYEQALSKAKDMLNYKEVRREDMEYLFPELAESEDEKVRKEIINYFQCQSEEEPTRKEIHDKWIAWLENIPYTIDHEKREGFHLGYKACLERQGEQEKDILEDAILDGNEDGLIAETIRYKNEKQSEQKFEMKTAEESLGIDSDTCNKIVDECILGEPKPKENKGNIGGISPNWSEEDGMILSLIVNSLKFIRDTLSHDDKYTVDVGSFEGQIEWLQSLKDRVQPQPKQEWSEEDEQHIDSLLKRLDALCRNKFERTRFAISEDRDWLKSLRPLKRWKPSDEQIDLLQAIINEPNNASSESCQIALKDILEQLKKLKEG